MDIDVSFKDVIEKSFTQYAGATIQSRALVDVRDCVKPSARQIYYCLYTDKFTSDRPFNKTLKGIGSSMRTYIHGDSSCEGIIMRSGQPFSMRYPLVEVEGSYGNLTESGNWAAPRYTASRLSELCNYLLQETDEYTISEWADNYDDTEQYPRVLSTLGFYNLVNGSMGIATGIASSIPQFNLVEINNALITLLKNPEADFDDIVCYPDFATGGTILNQQEVYESLKTGSGKGCLIQATIDYDKKDNALIVRDLPYGVYTNTICGEIEKLVTSDESIGITNINDLTGEDVCIKIYLSKKADTDSIKQLLYANTSLRKTYGINMTMLEDGRTPKVFSLKEALSAHLSHEKEVYVRLYNHQLDILQHRLKIILGLLQAIQNIESVIEVIKKSETTSDANKALQKLLSIDKEQAKAILDIKLSRLAHLESDKYVAESQELETEIKRLSEILEDEKLLKKEMIKRFKEVSKKYGDERRTKVIQKEIIKPTKTTQKKERVAEPCIISFNPMGYILRTPVAKFKDNSFDSFKTDTAQNILLFSNKGKFYRVNVKKIKECGPKEKGTPIGTLITLDGDEKILSVFPNAENESKPYVLFAMENGMVKKTAMSQYVGTTQNLKGMVATKTDCNIVKVAETNGNDVMLKTAEGMIIRFDAESVRASGRSSGGVKGITLQDGDKVVKCRVVGKSEFKKIPSQKRGGKGKAYENH